MTWRGGNVARDRAEPSAGRSEQIGSAALGAALGVVGAVLVVVHLVTANLDPTRHAYESMALMFTGAQVLVIGWALAATLVALLRVVRYGPAQRGRLLLRGSAALWAFTAVFWVTAWIVLQVLPGTV